jgi:hypothetical protein
VEPEVRHEETLAVESKSIDIQSLDSTPKSSPEIEPKTPKEKEIQCSEFLFSFEEVMFEDYGNTSNCFCIKTPPVPVTPFVLLK